MSSSEASARPVWYLDSSVALRVLLAHSVQATQWYDECANAGDAFASSRLLELEMTRVYRRESLDVDEIEEFLGELTLLTVDNSLITEAAAIVPHVKSLDALHLASALRIGIDEATVVTHDRSMAKVAEDLGFAVFDPVI